jgi:pyridoxamine 5'-phosphate oxidase
MSIISDIRHDYGKFKLDENSIKKNPFEQFSIWFNEALTGGFVDPNAMAVSTVNSAGKPSSRILLLKNFDERGFVFYSNFESRKGKEIENNPYASLLFFWDKFERQIRIEGRIEKTSYEESVEYYNSRPYTSRIGAWASEQSQPLKSRFTLMRKVAKLILQYPKKPPLPPFWGGYRLIPDCFEFWQGRESRLHDRFRYNKIEDEWSIQRLNP